MNLFFRKELMGDVTRLVLDIQEDTELDSFALNMISRNRIESLVPIQLSQFNNEHYLQYDISDKSTLATKLGSVLKKVEVEQLLNSIMQAFEVVEAYMLSESSLYLDWNYIFLDEDNKCFFLYLPFETEMSMDKMLFFRTIVEQIQEDYTERENYIYDIRNAFSRGAVKKIADLKDLLKKNYSSTVSTAEERFAEPVSVSSAPVKMVDSVAQVENSNAKSSSVGIKGFSLNIPDKEKAAIEMPGKNKEKPVINIPGKEKSSIEMPGKEGISLNIPGKESSSINIPGKAEASFSLPSKSGIPLNIPGKASVTEEKTAEKEPKKKLDVKLPELNLFGKKTGTKEGAPEVDMRSMQLEAEQMNREKKNEDMYESYEHTVMMDAPKSPLQIISPLPQVENAISAKLVRKNTSEVIKIDKANWTIGSGRTADHCILDNKTISRNHAVIQMQGGRFYFMDNNSSNGSYVDGRRVFSGEQIELKENSVIRLSDEDFVFQLS